MTKYIFKYKVADCFTFSEHEAEYIIDAENMLEAMSKWTEFRDELRADTYDAVTLISCKQVEEDLTAVTKWMIEG